MTKLDPSEKEDTRAIVGCLVLFIAAAVSGIFLGWLGVVLAFVAWVILFGIPESKRWQAARNRPDPGSADKYRRQASRLLEDLQPAPQPPPPANERHRIEMQLGELRIAREHFMISVDDDPVVIGQILVECNQKISELETQLLEAPDTEFHTGPPTLSNQAMLDEAVARQPTNPALYVQRAAYSISEQKYDAALADCDRALQLFPNHYEALTERGFANLYKGHTRQAKRDFQNALRDRPAYSRASAGLAHAYNVDGQHRTAIEVAQQGIQGEPGVARLLCHNQLALAYEQEGDLERAVHHFTAILQDYPNSRPDFAPDVRTRRARLLHKLGKDELAIYDLRLQLSTGPDDGARKLLNDILNPRPRGILRRLFS